MESFKPVIDELEARRVSNTDKKVERSLCRLVKLLKALDDKGVAPSSVDDELKRLKNCLTGQELKRKQLHGIFCDISAKMQKEHGYVTPYYYQNQWTALGMTLFGVPIGFAIATAIGNMSFFAIGLPIGMPIGMAIGMAKDKQAKAEGKMLAYGK